LQPLRQFARLRWRKIAAVAAAVAVAAVITAVAWPRRLGPSPPDGVTAQSAASVQRLRGPVMAGWGQGRQPLAEGATLYLGEAVDTGTGASLSLQTTVGKATLELGPNTAFTLAGRGEVRIAGGHVTASVPASLMLAVTTPHGQVVGRQTKVGITVLAHTTNVEVTEGEALLIRADGARELIKAGARAALEELAPAPARVAGP
jgi:hypothetical protein